MSSPEVTVISSKKTKEKRRLHQDSNSDRGSGSDFEPDSHLPNMPTSSNGAPSSSSPSSGTPAGASQSPGLRRSSRIRKKPHLHINDPVASSMSQRLSTRANTNDHDDDSHSDVPHRLEQIDPVSPKDFGLPDTHPTSRLRVSIHPVAMALITLHSHLTRTEVIGYLGGAVYITDDITHIIIAEAFPARGLGDRALARSGRSAFTEVEIDPESSVEVMSRLSAKGLCVVGWYHSHPDALFTVDPSRVDIENQANYQRYIFRDQPFVAAIVAPYNEQLPDHNPELLFFQVHGGESGDVPLRLPHAIDVLGDNEPAQPGGVLANYAQTNVRFPVDAFVAESLALVTNYATFPKRVRLEKEWRDGVGCVDKLRSALLGLATETGADTEQMRTDKHRLVEGVQCVMETIETAWADSAQRDEERLAKSRETARKRKRGRKK